MVQLLHDDRHTTAYMVREYMRVSCWWVPITSNQYMTCCTPADGRVIVRHIWHGSMQAAKRRIAFGADATQRRMYHMQHTYIVSGVVSCANTSASGGDDLRECKLTT